MTLLGVSNSAREIQRNSFSKHHGNGSHPGPNNMALP